MDLQTVRDGVGMAVGGEQRRARGPGGCAEPRTANLLDVPFGAKQAHAGGPLDNFATRHDSTGLRAFLNNGCFIHALQSRSGWRQPESGLTIAG
jgi:hypothetical protein